MGNGKKTRLGATINLKDGDEALSIIDLRAGKANYEQIFKPAAKKVSNFLAKHTGWQGNIKRLKGFAKTAESIGRGIGETISDSGKGVGKFLKDQQKLTKTGLLPSIQSTDSPVNRNIGTFKMPHSPLNYKERNEHVVDSTNLAKTNPAKAAMIYGPNLEASLEGAYQEGVNQNQWRLKDNPDMDLSGYGEKSQDQYFTDLRSGQFDQQYADDFNRALSKNIKKLRYVVPNQKGFPSTGEMSDFPTETVTRGQIGKVRDSWFGNWDERSDSALNYKDDFDIDYSGAKAVDLGNIPASDFTKAKKKLVEGYGGPNNPDYRMDKGDYYWNEKKGKIRSGYTEYPEDAGDIDPRYLGKNWDNAPKRQSSQEKVYNMTPDTIRITNPTHFKLKENEYINEDDFENQFDKIKGDSSTFPQFSVQDYSKLKKDKKGFYVTKLKD